MDTDLLSDTFVDLADTMVADFDVIDFLHMLTDRTVALLGASAAGVMLADPRGELRVAAASSEEAGLLELFQLQNDQGPCLVVLPHRPARHRHRPGRPGPAVAPVRPGRHPGRVRDGGGAADAAAGAGHRRAEPVQRRTRLV
jgi:hypothetical protein